MAISRLSLASIKIDNQKSLISSEDKNLVDVAAKLKINIPVERSRLLVIRRCLIYSDVECQPKMFNTGKHSSYVNIIARLKKEE